MAAQYPRSARRRLFRSRRDLWFSGVCGGLSEYSGINAGLIRLAFVASTFFFGGFGLTTYLVAWVAIPGEPDTESGEARQEVPGLRNIAIGVAFFGTAFALLLILGDGATLELGWGVVAAPVVVAVGAAMVRGGRGRSRIALVVLGLGMTVLLGTLNYSPTVGGRTEQPASPLELDGYSNVFGTMTIDLTALDINAGNLTVRGVSAFGDVIVLVPPGTEVRDDQGATSTSSNSTASDAGLSIDLDISSLFGSVEVIHARP